MCFDSQATSILAIDQVKQAIGLLSNIRQLRPYETSDLLVIIQRAVRSATRFETRFILWPIAMANASSVNSALDRILPRRIQ